MIFFKTIAYSFTVWLLAALINAFLLAVFLAIVQTDAKGMISFIPAMVGSLIFSAPGIFCFWIFFLIAVFSNKNGQPLFRLLLGTGSVCAFFCGLIAGYLFRDFLDIHCIIIAFMAMIASMLSLFIHRTTFIFINKPSTGINYV
jgi:hypothetical protein